MTETAPAHGAGVRFPPPLIYALVLVAGWLIDRRWPLPITTQPGHWRPVVAAIFILIWLGLFAAALTRFRRAHTTIIPHKPVSAFVSDGPYRFTRNPMYVSLAALYLGGALLLNSWWIVLLLPVALLIVQRAVIAREERYLRERFPVEYPAYCARVRRWL